MQQEQREAPGSPAPAAVSLYEAVGGAETFVLLVELFYAAVAHDPILRPMYPESLDDAKHRLTLFLIQYFGGPQTYSEERGHPRLRQRHFRFRVDRAARDAWVRHMTAALASLDLPAPQHEQMLEYVESSATFLINQPG